MEAKETAVTEAQQLKESVSDIYARILRERTEKAVAKEAERRRKKEEKEGVEKGPNGERLTKKEKRQKEMDQWKEIVVGLVGDDLEYSSTKKKKRKKYTKWIGDDLDGTIKGDVKKPKKPKKRNYQKEFDPELNLLKTMINDQAKFTADLQRRFNNAAGPATKDAMIPNKTLVELASVINAGRSNSLGLLKEVGGLKKTIAELYLRQQKQDYDLSGGKNSSDDAARDLMLLGSNIMAAQTGDVAPDPYGFSGPLDTTPQMAAAQATQTVTPSSDLPQYEEVDPANIWANEGVVSTVANENVEKTIFFEKSRSTGEARFVAIAKDDGRELQGCPTLPTIDPSKVVIKEGADTVQDQFNMSYPIRYVD